MSIISWSFGISATVQQCGESIRRVNLNKNVSRTRDIELNTNVSVPKPIEQVLRAEVDKICKRCDVSGHVPMPSHQSANAFIVRHICLWHVSNTWLRILGASSVHRGDHTPEDVHSVLATHSGRYPNLCCFFFQPSLKTWTFSIRVFYKQTVFPTAIGTPLVAFVEYTNIV